MDVIKRNWLGIGVVSEIGIRCCVGNWYSVLCRKLVLCRELIVSRIGVVSRINWYCG